MGSKVQVALIGYGHLGKWHAQKAFESRSAELVAIVEPSDAQAKKAKEAYPNVIVVSKLAEIISKIDAALVVTPTSFHFEYLADLIKENKHVFCEKPVVETAAQSDEILKALSSKNLIVQAGHSERLHLVWEKVKENASFFCETGLIHINRLAPFKGRATDVDVVQDLMSHDLDLLLYLFKEKPISLKATGLKIRTTKWDYVQATLSFKSGRQAIITSGRGYVKEVRSFEIINSLGCLYVDLLEGKYSIADSLKTNPEEYVETFSYEKRDHLKIEQENFYKSILNQTRPIVSFKEGADVVELINKVIESLETKKEIFM